MIYFDLVESEGPTGKGGGSGVKARDRGVALLNILATAAYSVSTTRHSMTNHMTQ